MFSIFNFKNSKKTSTSTLTVYDEHEEEKRLSNTNSQKVPTIIYTATILYFIHKFIFNTIY